MKAGFAQAESCCVYVKPENFMQHMHDIIPKLFDCWANPLAHLLLLKSSKVRVILMILFHLSLSLSLSLSLFPRNVQTVIQSPLNRAKVVRTFKVLFFKVFMSLFWKPHPPLFDRRKKERERETSSQLFIFLSFKPESFSVENFHYLLTHSGRH